MTRSGAAHGIRSFRRSTRTTALATTQAGGSTRLGSFFRKIARGPKGGSTIQDPFSARGPITPSYVKLGGEGISSRSRAELDVVPEIEHRVGSLRRALGVIERVTGLEE